MAVRSLCLMTSLAVVTTACVPEFDTDLSELTEPKVLAIAATPAEAGPQQPVELEALVAVPEGQRTPALNWTMCLARKPLTELGPVNPVCFDADNAAGDVVELGRGSHVRATLDKDVCKLFGPLRPSPMGSEGAGRPADPDVTGGFYQPFVAHLGESATLGDVRIDCDLANVDRDEAIDYRKRYRPNENPLITELSRIGDAGDVALLGSDELIQLRAGSRMTLRASWDECSTESQCGDGLCTAFEDQATCAEDCTGTLRGCTGAQPYVWYDAQRQRVQSRREGISVAWYASRGHFESEQTGLDEDEAAAQSSTENVYIASSHPGPATLWLVIRDSRGGQSWQIRHVEVTP